MIEKLIVFLLVAGVGSLAGVCIVVFKSYKRKKGYEKMKTDFERFKQHSRRVIKVL